MWGFIRTTVKLLLNVAKSKEARQAARWQMDRMTKEPKKPMPKPNKTVEVEVVEEPKAVYFADFADNLPNLSLHMHHRKFPGKWVWQYRPFDFGDGDRAGIALGNEEKDEYFPTMRTKGYPSTIGRIWDSYGEEIRLWSRKFNVPVELILACIATESGGKREARREEPGWISDDQTPHRVSVGLMQVLISTARSTLSDPDIDAEWLNIPSNSIQAGTAYIAIQERKTGFDPPLVAAAFNSGGIYKQNGEENKFKLRNYPIGTSHHIERFCSWFGDALHITRQET